MKINTTQDSKLFSYETEHSQTVWMSHGDEVVKLPDGFKPVATSEQACLVPVAACGDSAAQSQHVHAKCPLLSSR